MCEYFVFSFYYKCLDDNTHTQGKVQKPNIQLYEWHRPDTEGQVPCVLSPMEMLKEKVKIQIEYGIEMNRDWEKFAETPEAQCLCPFASQ